MAHLGKAYKLQFRRDLHLDLRNNEGIPEAWQVTFNNIVTPFGMFTHLGPFLCVYVPVGPDLQLEYDCLGAPLFGHHWNVIFQLTNLPTRIADQQSCDYFLQDDALGFLTVGNAMYRLGAYNGFTVSPFTGIVTHTPGYGWNNPAQTFSGNAAPWSVYP